MNLKEEQELHRNLALLTSNSLVSEHFNLENKMLIGQPLRKVFEMLKDAKAEPLETKAKDMWKQTIGE